MHGIDNDSYAYSMWPVVVFNILQFLWFAISFVRPKGRVEWRASLGYENGEANGSASFNVNISP